MGCDNVGGGSNLAAYWPGRFVFDGIAEKLRCLPAALLRNYPGGTSICLFGVACIVRQDRNYSGRHH